MILDHRFPHSLSLILLTNGTNTYFTKHCLVRYMVIFYMMTVLNLTVRAMIHYFLLVLILAIRARFLCRQKPQPQLLYRMFSMISSIRHRSLELHRIPKICLSNLKKLYSTFPSISPTTLPRPVKINLLIYII